MSSIDPTTDTPEDRLTDLRSAPLDDVLAKLRLRLEDIAARLGETVQATDTDSLLAECDRLIGMMQARVDAEQGGAA